MIIFNAVAIFVVVSKVGTIFYSDCWNEVVAAVVDVGNVGPEGS